MKKNFYYSLVVLLSGFLLGACNSSNDDENDNNTNAAYTETTLDEAPTWQMDWSNDQERPNWTAPDASAYENWTILKVQIEEALLPYVSSGDLMALFVNGELRSLAQPAIALTGGGQTTRKFLMKAYGNETGSETVTMSLQYYNETLRHIFTLTDDISLDSDETTGIDEAFIPEFTAGSAKYPVQKAVSVESLLSRAGIVSAFGGKVAAFVGDECRGTATLAATGGTTLVVYGRSAGEVVTLKYYDAVTGKLYTLPNAVSM